MTLPDDSRFDPIYNSAKFKKMSRAPEALQPKQFTPFPDSPYFHGTSQEIKGKTLQPSSKTGIENYDYDDTFPDAEARKSSVFFTHDNRYYWGDDGPPAGRDAETRAWRWADSGTHNREGGRARVYTVEPQGKVKPDNAITGAFMAPKAKITGRIDIPSEDALDWIDDRENFTRMEGGVQGTFPQVDWRTHVDHEVRRKQWDQKKADAEDERTNPIARREQAKFHRTQGTLFTDRRTEMSDNPRTAGTLKKISGQTWKGEEW